MTPELVTELCARLKASPRTIGELHLVARAAGSTWSLDQVALLLSCRPDLIEADGVWSVKSTGRADPLEEALLAVATTNPLPAAALLARLPAGVVASAAALCEAARRNPDLELLQGSRIRRRY
jgi:hypothetical protein